MGTDPPGPQAQGGPLGFQGQGVSHGILGGPLGTIQLLLLALGAQALDAHWPLGPLTLGVGLGPLWAMFSTPFSCFGYTASTLAFTFAF